MNARNAQADATEPTESALAQDTATEVTTDDAVSAPESTDGEVTMTGAGEATGVTTAAQTGEVAPAPVKTVYVTAPQPPRRKGNRGIGALLALLATIVFAAVYAGVTALLIMFVRPEGVEGAIGQFVTGPVFYVPVLSFLVLMVLWALLANRASWWAWVLGSLIIAALVYGVSIGVLLLVAGGFGLTASQAADTFTALALNPAIIVAALLAREVSVWFGAVIAARGRKVRERNYDAWQEFEREEATRHGAAQERAESAGPSAV